MPHSIPEDAQRLANRLRMLALEIETAARYGVPIPSQFTVSGHQYLGASFAADPHEFAPWVDYTEAETETYEHAGSTWRRATAEVNGLPLSFAMVADEPVPYALAEGVRL